MSVIKAKRIRDLITLVRVTGVTHYGRSGRLERMWNQKTGQLRKQGSLQDYSNSDGGIVSCSKAVKLELCPINQVTCLITI